MTPSACLKEGILRTLPSISRSVQFFRLLFLRASDAQLRHLRELARERRILKRHRKILDTMLSLKPQNIAIAKKIHI